MSSAVVRDKIPVTPGSPEGGVTGDTINHYEHEEEHLPTTLAQPVQEAPSPSVHSIAPLNIEEPSRQSLPHDPGFSPPTVNPWSFVIAFIVVYVIIGIFEPRQLLSFLLTLIPTATFALIWKLRFSDYASAKTLTYGYGWSFFVGSLSVFAIQWVIGFFLIMIWSAFGGLTDAGYAVLYLFYYFLAEALPSEGMKFFICSKARRDHPDVTSVSSYLLYAVSCSLGFGTFIVILQQLLIDVSFKDLVAFVFIRLCFEIPLHIETGYIIGTGVARREINNNHQHWLRICALPIVVRGLNSFLLTIIFWWNKTLAGFYTGSICVYLAFVLGLLIFCVYLSRTTPSTFGLLAENEEEHHQSPVPDTAAHDP